MRLIDADALKTDLTRFYDNEVTAKQLIDEQPTIDAISVEWLLKKKASCIHMAAGCIHAAGRAYQTAWLIDDLIKEWRKEQEVAV